jgi:cell division protein ZapD
MTSILYEHPLNEKLRSYLRVEDLFRQLQHLRQCNEEVQLSSFFAALFSLIDVLDRNDIRSDLCKDLDRCQSALVQWSAHPDIADDALTDMLKQTIRLQSELLKGGKLAGALKEDKFLAPLRQRFGITGGTCYFDVPQLQYWFSLPIEQRQQQIGEWLQHFQLVADAIRYILQFIRERGQFQSWVAYNGFYQSNTEQFELLRIRYPIASGCYPTVSGNRYRYAIRFMQLCETQGRTSSAQSIEFELACC